MADEVRIPVSLDINDIDFSELNLQNVSKAIEQEMSRMNKSITDVFGTLDVSKPLNKTTRAISAAFSSVESSYHKVFEAQKQYNIAIQNAARPVEEYRTALKGVQELTELMEYGQWFIDRAELDGDTKSLAEFKAQYAEIEELRQQARAEVQPEQWVNLGTPEAIEAVHEALNGVLAAFGDLSNAAQNYNDTVTRTAEAESQQATNTEQSLGRSSNAATRFGEILGRVKSVTTSVASTTKLLGKAFISAFNVAKKMVSVLIKGLRSVLGFIKKLASGVKGLISKFSQLFKHGKSTTTGLGDGFKKLQRNVLMFGFGFRTAYFAIKRLRRIFTDAFKTMAAQFPELNVQLNAFTMALNRLKGSLGTMFQPIISVAIPILVMLMEYLSRAMEAVASFFAVLTGQKVIYKATSNQEDYAASLNDTANAEKKARKEHEKTVASYDKLDIIPQDKNSSTSGNTGVDTPDLPLNVTYEKADVDKAVSEFAQMIKDAWAKADFTEVGQYLTEKALAVLDFFQTTVLPRITSFINKVSNSIVTFVNGFDFEAVGAKVGSILNDLLNQLDVEKLGAALASIRNMFIRFVDGLITEIDWANLGTTIANGVMGFLNELDIDAAVHAIYTLVNGIATAIVNFVGTIDWEQLATDLYNHLADLFNGLDFETISSAIADPINAIITFISTFVSKIDWAKLGKKIAKGFDKLVKKIDGQKLLKTLTEAFNGAITALSTVIDETPWSEYAQNLADGVDDIVSGINWEEAGSMLGDGLGTLLDMFATFILEVDWEEVGKSISEFLATFMEKLSAAIEKIDWYGVGQRIYEFLASIDWGKLLQDLLTLVFDILYALGGTIVGLLEPILTDLWNAIVDWAGDVWDGIVEIWYAVGDWFNENVIQPIINFFTGLWESVSGFFSQLWDDIVAIWNTVSTWFHDNVIQPIVDMFNDRIEEIKKLFTGLWNGIKEVWSVVSTWFNEKVIQPTVDFFKKLPEKVKKFFTNLWDDIKKVWKTVSDWFNENVIKPVVDWFKGLWEDVSGFFTNLWTDIKDVWSSVSTWFDENVIQPVADFFTGLWNGISQSATDVWESIKEVFGAVASWIDENIVQPVKKIINGIIGTVESMINGLISGLNALIRGINKISFDVPDWVPIIGGKKFGFNIKEISELHIPRLAQGAVIPPNKEFLAMLGDQKHGTNIEAPLDTIKQAFLEAMQDSRTLQDIPREPIILQLDGKTVARVVWDESKKKYKQTGRYSPMPT